MKKVLLVKPNYRYLPIGLAYIASALKQDNIEYDILDAYFTIDQDLTDILTKKSYCAIASGGLLGSYSFFKNFFKTVKSIDKNIPCILGGQITADVKADILFNTIPIDYLVIGEGEITFPKLIFAINNDCSEIKTINGIAYRIIMDGKTDIYQKQKSEPLDITNQNWMPSWDFINVDLYKSGNIPALNGMPILSARGCTGRCSFCSPTNKPYRHRPISHILEEVEILSSKYEFNHLAFINEIFFPDENMIYDFCQEYKKADFKKTWHCLLRLDIDPAILSAMKDAGCNRVIVGVESGSDRVLDYMKKDINVNQTKKFITTAKENKLLISGSFMMCNYEETYDDIIKTTDLMIDLHISANMTLTINYPGTLNYIRAIKRGLIKDEIKYIKSLDHIWSNDYYYIISDCLSGRSFYLNLSSIDTEELFEIIEKEMRRYFSENYYIRNVKSRIDQEKNLLTLHGDCPFCGFSIEADYDFKNFNPMHLQVKCNYCEEANLYFRPLSVEYYYRYFLTIKNQISNASKIAVIGWPSETFFFLKRNLFLIDYQKIVGFVSHEQMPEGFVMNHKIISFTNMKADSPDKWLVLSALPKDIETKINMDTDDIKSNLIFLTPKYDF